MAVQGRNERLRKHPVELGCRQGPHVLALSVVGGLCQVQGRIAHQGHSVTRSLHGVLGRIQVKDFDLHVGARERMTGYQECEIEADGVTTCDIAYLGVWRDPRSASLLQTAQNIG